MVFLDVRIQRDPLGAANADVLYSNLPIGAVAFVLIFIFLKLEPTEHSKQGSFMSRVKRLDLIGIVLIVASVCCLVLALHWGNETNASWRSSRVIGLFIGFGLLLIAFMYVQWREGDLATIPIRVLKQRSILMGSLFAFFLEMSVYVVCLVPISDLTFY